jgi:hypothetical protein
MACLTVFEMFDLFLMQASVYQPEQKEDVNRLYLEKIKHKLLAFYDIIDHKKLKDVLAADCAFLHALCLFMMALEKDRNKTKVKSTSIL